METNLEGSPVIVQLNMIFFLYIFLKIEHGVDFNLNT